MKHGFSLLVMEVMMFVSGRGEEGEGVGIVWES